MRQAWAVVAAVAIGGAVPAGGPDWPVPVRPAAEPGQAFDPAAVAALPAAFRDDAPACTLYSRVVMTLHPDGAVETTYHEITRLNGRKAIDTLGEYTNVGYNPAYETLTLHRACVHKAAGGTVGIAPRHVQLRDKNVEHLVYDLSKQLTISFPGLEPGDCIDVHWSTRGTHPESAGHLFQRYQFGDDKHPTARDEFVVRLPQDRLLKYAAENGGPEPDVKLVAGRRQYTWVATDRPTPPKLDHAPPKDERRPGVMVSTFQTWSEVDAWERNAARHCQACTPELKRLARAVADREPTPAGKARALAGWVRREVRYLSSGAKHDYTPHPPADVVANRYGDCKDTAQLLTVLLREAGLEAGVVTLATRGDGALSEAVPSPWGNHALCVVTIDGEDHWIDTTTTLSGWDVLPDDDRDRPCYVVGARGLRFAKTPPLAPADTRTATTTLLTVAADGTATGERTATAFGLSAGRVREALADAPRGEQKQTVSEELHNAYGKARLLDLRCDGLADPDKPTVTVATFALPEFAGGDRQKREAILSMSELWAPLTSVTVDADRPEALDLGAPFDLLHRVKVVAGPAQRIDAVAEAAAQSRWGRFSRSVKYSDDEPGTLEVEFRCRLTRPRVEVAELAKFQAWLDEVHAGYRVGLTFRPTTRIADAPKLEAALTATPADAATAATAATLAELYTAADRPADARRALAAARTAAPDDADLWRLSVQAAADAEEEMALLGQMVTRFATEPKYALSLADAQIEAGRFDAARLTLEKPSRAKRDPATRGKALALLARAALEQSQPKDATALVGQAQKAHPELAEQAEFLRLKGRIQIAAGDRDAAVQTLAAAADADADDPEPLALLAKLHREANRPAMALAALARLRPLASDDAEIAARAALEYALLDRPADALELAKSATDDDGLVPSARLPLGLALAATGRYADAKPHLEAQEREGPALRASLRTYLHLGLFTKATALLEPLRLLDDPDPALKREGDALTAFAARLPAGAWGEAGKCAEFLLQRGESPTVGVGDDALSRGVRAWRRLHAGQWTRALADAEAAIAGCPPVARGYMVRGKVRADRGNADAVADLEKAVALTGRADATAWRFLVEGLDALGKADAAKAAAVEGLKRCPDDAALRALAAELTVGR